MKQAAICTAHTGKVNANSKMLEIYLLQALIQRMPEHRFAQYIRNNKFGISFICPNIEKSLIKPSIYI
jgi:hypothetical protein